MKRPLLVAAVLAAAPLMAGTAKADPLQMFNINAPAAGVMTFSGTGTANFNQSLGTTNSINLGSSTNVGVNAAASSTQDYESSGFAQLDLDATSRMQQTIGTATTAFNASTAAESASRAADTTAFSAANSSKYGATWGRDYNAEYSTESGWKLNASATSDTPDQAYERTTSVGVEYASEAEYTASSQAHWQAGWDREYNSAYETAYSTAQSSATQENEGTSGTGVIIANFTTTEKGTSDSAAGALGASFAAQAEAAADLQVGAANQGSYEWQAAYNAEYSAAFAAADANAERESISNVEVQGLGSIADINSKDTSTFQAESVLLSTTNRPDTVGNGNASAGASLSTSSYANASNATTASGFMQAFTGGGLDLDSVITNITGSTSAGYDVTTVQTAPGSTTTTYTVDSGTGDVVGTSTN